MNRELRQLLSKVKDAVLRESLLEEWNERAAIVEYDGCETRENAEALATAELRAKVERLKGNK